MSVEITQEMLDQIQAIINGTDGVTLPLLLEAEQLSADDLMYVVQGSGLNRDRQTRIGSLIDPILSATNLCTPIKIDGSGVDEELHLAAITTPMVDIQIQDVPKLSFISIPAKPLIVRVHVRNENLTDTAVLRIGFDEYTLGSSNYFLGHWTGSEWTWRHCPPDVQPITRPKESVQIVSSRAITPEHGCLYRLVGNNILVTLEDVPNGRIAYFIALPQSPNHALGVVADGITSYVARSGDQSPTITGYNGSIIAVRSNNRWLLIGGLSAMDVRGGSIGRMHFAPEVFRRVWRKKAPESDYLGSVPELEFTIPASYPTAMYQISVRGRADITASDIGVRIAGSSVYDIIFDALKPAASSGIVTLYNSTEVSLAGGTTLKTWIMGPVGLHYIHFYELEVTIEYNPSTIYGAFT